MKMEYESPVVEILHFDVKDTVMNTPGGCAAYTGAVCPYDGHCMVDVDVPNISAV